MYVGNVDLKVDTWDIKQKILIERSGNTHIFIYIIYKLRKPNLIIYHFFYFSQMESLDKVRTIYSWKQNLSHKNFLAYSVRSFSSYLCKKETFITQFPLVYAELLPLKINKN